MVLDTPPGPDSPQYWVEASVELRRSGNLQAAVEACQRALALAPGDAGALCSLAHALRWQGRFAEAFDAAENALAAAPRMAAAWFNRAASLEGLGRPEEALAGYRRALELKPDYAEAWSNLGNVLADSKRDDEALEAYRRAAHHDPNLAPIWSNLGGALRHGGRTLEAIEACRRATALDPEYAQGWTNLGLALHDQGQLAEAVDALRRSVELDPAALAWQNLGEVLEVCGRLEEAEQACRQALAAGPPTAALLTRLGSLLKQQGRVDEAIDAFKQALAGDPNHVAALAEIGRSYFELRRSQNAETHYRAAVAALLAAARSGDAESALEYESRIYQGFVQSVETEDHYRRCFSDWREEMAALGERFRQPHPEPDAGVDYFAREIAFFLHAGHVLGHTEVLLKLLEDPRSRELAGVTPRLYVFGSFDDDFLRRAERLRVPVVLLERELPRGRATPFHQRFSWLRERFRRDRIGACVWVSSPLWTSFAFSMRIAPVQIFWALRFHPVADSGIDGYITYGSRHERERTIGAQTWRVCPMPLALEVTPPDATAIAELRQRLPQGFLMGTLARPEKIDSKPFLDSVAGILKANPHAHYLWTGRKEHAGIADFFRSAGVAGRCHFVGWVDTRLYAAALDLFLESFPLGTGVVPYQALGAGVPLLSYFSQATLFGVNFWHEFPDGAPSNLERYPILCAETPGEYVRLGNELVANPDFRSRVGARGKRFFEEEISKLPADSRRFLDTIVEIAANTLARRRPDAR